MAPLALGSMAVRRVFSRDLSRSEAVTPLGQ